MHLQKFVRVNKTDVSTGGETRYSPLGGQDSHNRVLWPRPGPVFCLNITAHVSELSRVFEHAKQHGKKSQMLQGEQKQQKTTPLLPQIIGSF